MRGEKADRKGGKQRAGCDDMERRVAKVEVPYAREKDKYHETLEKKKNTHTKRKKEKKTVNPISKEHD